MIFKTLITLFLDQKFKRTIMKKFSRDEMFHKVEILDSLKFFLKIISFDIYLLALSPYRRICAQCQPPMTFFVTIKPAKGFTIPLWY